MLWRWSEQTGEGMSRPRLLGGVWKTVGPPLRWGPKRKGRFEEMLVPVGHSGYEGPRGPNCGRCSRSQAQGRNQDWYRGKRAAEMDVGAPDWWEV